MVPDTAATIRRAYNLWRDKNKPEDDGLAAFRDRIFNYLAIWIDDWRNKPPGTKLTLPTSCQPVIDELIEEREGVNWGEQLSDETIEYFTTTFNDLFAEILDVLGSPLEIAALFI